MTPLLAQRSRTDRSFERLYRRHAGDVYRYALAVLRNPADAEDVTQTTFLNAYRAFTNGERPQIPRNWLIAIAHNVCRQRFRQAARRPNEVELNEGLAEAFVPEDTIAVEDIQRAFRHLAFNQRSALVMRELEGRSYAEIAQILELSPSAVETLIFRARRAVREQLEGTLTCAEAERAISKQVDGELARADKGQLRAHLRECKSCATIARRLRAQRSAWKALGAIPLPGSLAGLFGGSGASVTTGLGLTGAGAVGLKAASVVTVVAVASGTAYEGRKLVVDKAAKDSAVAASVATGGAASSAATSLRAARPYAPGQLKPDGERAAKPAVPPGLAKTGVAEARVAQAHREQAKAAHAAPAAKLEAPGQVRKTEQPIQAERASPSAPVKRTPPKKPSRSAPVPASTTPQPAAPAARPQPAKPDKIQKSEAAPPETPQAPPETPQGPADAAAGNDDAGGNGGGRPIK